MFKLSCGHGHRTGTHPSVFRHALGCRCRAYAYGIVLSRVDDSYCPSVCSDRNALDLDLGLIGRNLSLQPF